MKAQKTVDIKQGITPKELIGLLQKNGKVILKGKEKTFEIDNEKIQIQTAQRLELENIPTEIKGLKITDLQKELLLNNGTVQLGNMSIKLEKELMQLKIEQPIGQQQLKLK